MSEASSGRRAFLWGMTGLGLAASGRAALAAPKPGESATPDNERVVTGGSPYATFSRAVAYNGIVYVAGVVGQKPGTRELASTDFAPQCRQAMDNLQDSVEASGSSMDKVLKCGVFLTDYDDFATFNEIYVKYFPKSPPARSTVIVKELVVPGARLEIDCVTCVD